MTATHSRSTTIGMAFDPPISIFLTSPRLNNALLICCTWCMVFGHNTGASAAEAVAPRPFTVVVPPDTQCYTDAKYGGEPDMFTSQTRWIVDAAEELNIAFVLHVGDITFDNDAEGWENAARSLAKLDEAGIPYVLAAGNHDGYMEGHLGLDKLNASFPLSGVENEPYFGGVFEEAHRENAYFLFEAGGVSWLVLVLEFGPRDVVLEWADTILANHPDHRAILLTHAFLFVDGTLHDEASEGHDVDAPTISKYGRPNDGADIWDKMLKKHANVAFAFNGHVQEGTGQARAVLDGDEGNRVHAMLTNFQKYEHDNGARNGGNGLLRSLLFAPRRDRVVATTWSPHTTEQWLSDDFRFELADLEVFHDDVPPRLVGGYALGPDQAVLWFDEPVSAPLASDIANFTFDPPVSILSAELVGQRAVVLLTEDMRACESYTATALAAEDLRDPPNALTTGSSTQVVRARALLDEDFSRLRHDGWFAVDEGEMGGRSKWRIMDVVVSEVGNIYGPTPTTITGRKGTYLYWCRPDAQTWADYEISVRLRSGDNDGIGLMFRYQGKRDYLKLEMDAQESAEQDDKERGYTRLSSLVAGAEIQLGRVETFYEEGKWHRLRIAVKGHDVQVWLDGEDVFGGAVSATGPIPMRGTVALTTWGCNDCEFDDLLVTLPGPEPPCEPCDRAVDNERDCSSGTAPVPPLGACRAGRQLCRAGFWGPCLGEVLPEEEVCDDEVDNDCDGQTDTEDEDDCRCTPGDTFACYDGSAATCGVGVCKAGRNTCAEGKWGKCEGQVLPQAEACDDGADNDCDGLVDGADAQDCPPVAKGESEGCSSTACTRRGRRGVLLLLLLLMLTLRRRVVRPECSCPPKRKAI